jgi:hypothetical protein
LAVSSWQSAACPSLSQNLGETMASSSKLPTGNCRLLVKILGFVLQCVALTVLFRECLF